MKTLLVVGMVSALLFSLSGTALGASAYDRYFACYKGLSRGLYFRVFNVAERPLIAFRTGKWKGKTGIFLFTKGKTHFYEEEKGNTDDVRCVKLIYRNRKQRLSEAQFSYSVSSGFMKVIHPNQSFPEASCKKGFRILSMQSAPIAASQYRKSNPYLSALIRELVPAVFKSYQNNVKETSRSSHPVGLSSGESLAILKQCRISGDKALNRMVKVESAKFTNCSSCN